MAPYTHAISSPYLNTYNTSASYQGIDLYNDLLKILNDFQPDMIVVPHPKDMNSDHSAVSDFTRFAIAEYLTTNDLKIPEVLTYLVHFEGYPIPRGNNTSKSLLPPRALANYGEGWVTYSLNSTELSQKKAALNEYGSQLRTSGNYLRSFIRANEIFFVLPAIEMPVASYQSDEVLEDDLQTEITNTEPSRERASRLILPGADLVSWRVARVGDLLCFGSETRGPASKYFNYIILAKLPDGTNIRLSQLDDLIWITDQYFGACFNLGDLGNPSAIGFSAETRQRTILVDCTAWLFVDLKDR